MFDIKKIVKKLYTLSISSIIIVLIIFSLLNLFVIPFYNKRIEDKYISKYNKTEIIKIQSIIKYILLTFSSFILIISLFVYLLFL